ncbi:MAG: hypothetical protein WD768_09900 [Phycisphaeraceae bacterium]
MFRFVVKLFGFALVQAALVVALIAATEMPVAFWGTTRGKHEIADRAPSPRMIISGGSSDVFAFDGKALREATGYYPVSLAVYAGLGVEYFLKEAEREARRGDVIFLSLEPHHFATFGINEEVLVQMVVERPRSIFHIPLRHLPLVLDELLNHIRVHLDARISSLFRRRRAHEVPVELDEYGIIILDRPTPKPYKSPAPEEMEVLKAKPHELPELIDRLNAFVRRCRSRGIEVVLAMSPHDRAFYDFNQAYIDRVHDELVKHFEGLLLGPPSQFAWPESYLYDSMLHLNLEGRRIHTERVIEEWKKLNLKAP